MVCKIIGSEFKEFEKGADSVSIWSVGVRLEGIRFSIVLNRIVYNDDYPLVIVFKLDLMPFLLVFNEIIHNLSSIVLCKYRARVQDMLSS